MNNYASYEDYLYILVGLVWFIFSIYKAKKKKDANGSKPAETDKPSFLETIIEEIGLKTEEQTPVYADSYNRNSDVVDEINTNSDDNNQMKIDNDKAFSYDDDYEKSNYSSTIDVKGKRKSVSYYGNSATITKTKPSKKRAKKVDLRKAIIYSEILKKQYF